VQRRMSWRRYNGAWGTEAVLDDARVRGSSLMRGPTWRPERHWLDRSGLDELQGTDSWQAASGLPELSCIAFRGYKE